VLAVALVALTLGELATRAFLTSPSTQQPDPVLGWTYVPGSTVFNAREGGARLVMNELGLNGDALLDAGLRTRVLALGDSFTEALQVARADNFVSLVQADLDHYELINLGRSDMGPAHYPVVLDRFADELGAELILLFAAPGDVSDVMADDVVVSRDGESGLITSVTVTRRTADRLKEVAEPLIERSALATYMMRRAKPLLAQFVGGSDDTSPPGRIFPYLRELTGLELVDPADIAFENEVIDRLTFLLDEMAQVHPIVLVDIPLMAYGPDRVASVAVPDEQRWYRTAAERAGVPYLDTGPAFVAEYASSGQPPHGFANHRIGIGHLNEVGHRAVADVVADWLERNGPEAPGAAP